MTDEDQTLLVPAGAYTENTAVKVVTSGDAGRSWGEKVTVGTRRSSWPGLVDLGAGRFLYLFEKGGEGVRCQVVGLN